MAGPPPTVRPGVRRQLAGKRLGVSLKITATAAVGAAATVLLLASPASAQAYIGTIIGQASAQRQEALCQANRQPLPSARIRITGRINAQMARLRAPSTPPKDLAKLFTKRDGSKIANATQLISAEEFRTLISGPGAWRHLVVAADHNAARGVWRSVTPGVDGGPEIVREFGFDFVEEWGSWKVLHAQEYPGPLFAPDPDPFCHLWNTASY